MKTKIFMLGLMMSLSVVLIAQPEENGAKSFHGKPQLGFKPGEFKKDANRLNLSEAQKESFKASTMATQKLLLPLRNELGEAEAHQKTLRTYQQKQMRSGIPHHAEQKLINLTVRKTELFLVRLAGLNPPNFYPAQRKVLSLLDLHRSFRWFPKIQGRDNPASI